MWLPLCFLALLAGVAAASSGEKGEAVYVVYMGAVPPQTSPGLLRESHLRLVGTVLKRGKTAQRAVVQQYKHGFSGFAARLSKDEAAALRRKPGVVSVFRDPVYQLHTTRSWDFLQQTDVKIDSARRTPCSASAAVSPSSSPPSSPTTDTIIGLLDSGIWPESPTSRLAGFAPPRRRSGFLILHQRGK